MANLCVFLPGIAGSNLFSGPSITDYLWVNRVRLAFGAFELLRLSPDGVTPPGAAYPPITAGGALSPYYDAVQGKGAKDLAAAGYELQVLGYDFRQSIFRSGSFLASFVMNSSKRYDQIALVGHSMGGLVCRRAWSVLQQLGQQDLVKRVVTIASPHLGSWSSAELLSGGSDLPLQLALIAPKLINFQANTALPSTMSDLIEIIATWPSVYELLPVLPADGSGSDVLKAVYLARNWPATSAIQQQWLDHASGPYRAWLTDASAIPPYEVLTTVAGHKLPTDSGWSDVSAIGTPQGFAELDDGDSIVPTSSALLPLAKQVLRVSSHVSFPNDLVNDGQLVQLVTEQRSPLPPPPPPPIVPPAVQLAGGQGPLFRGPPIAQTGLWGVDP